MNSRISYSLTS